jgi:hypothetical protein
MVVFLGMKNYEVAIDKEKIYKAVYNITANAAAQRGDALRVATEDNDILLDEFLEKGKKLVEAALGRYGNGIEYPIENGVKLPSVLKYSMPENWDWKDELDERVNAFLADYITALWMGLTAEVTMPVLELMSILNKRKKPI